MGTLLKRLCNVRFSARTIKKLFAPDEKQRLLLKRYSGSPTVGAPYFSDISPEDFSVRKSIYLCQFEDFKYVMGSCNGLICLDNATDESLLWNPSTRETKIIRSKLLGRFSPKMVSQCFAGGFGYDYKSQDFKLIRFISNFEDYEYDLDTDSESESESYTLDNIQAEVYSLKNDSWKTIDYPGYFVMRKHACEEGYGFWLAYSSTDHFMLGFDFCTDELACHPLPYVGKSFGGSLHLEFANFEGSLCVIVFPKLGTDKAFDLWLYDGKAWYKEVRFCVTGAERPLGFWGRILFLEGIDRGLMAYDIDTRRAEKLDIYDFPDQMRLVPYVDSDMSIMGFCGKSDSKNRMKVKIIEVILPTLISPPNVDFRAFATGNTESVRSANLWTEDGADQNVMMNFQAAQAKFHEIRQLKSNLVLENTEPEVFREMDEKSLEEELEALLSDKAGGAEYVQSMQLQIMKFKVSLQFYIQILVFYFVS